MFNFWSAIATNARRHDEASSPFIGPSLPFIGPGVSPVRPSVGVLRPSVGFWGFFGFTLLELLATITVIAILSAIAVPGFLDFARNNRLTTATNELVSDMLVARNEAVKRNRPVVICKTLDATAASPVCDANVANPWTTGWIVFVDSDDDGTRDAGEFLVRLHGPLLNTITLTGFGAPIQNLLSYRPSGRPFNFTGATFKLCDERGANKAKALIVSGAGQTRISDQKDGSGTLKDHQGNPITCP
jgi:type IV fimbrial biogenesis protein FimT